MFVDDYFKLTWIIVNVHDILAIVHVIFQIIKVLLIAGFVDNKLMHRI